jgi:hydrogenase/urease accessory protein HupE
MSVGLRGLLLALLMLIAGKVSAHEMSMAEMELRETAPGQFIWMWTALNEDASRSPVPHWPEGCSTEDNTLRCGRDGLRGALAMEGVGQRYSAVILKIFWRDGQSSVHTLTAAQPEVHLYGSADDRRGGLEVASAYVVLGVEHILSGIDHLLFVLGLLFLVGFERRLIATITAFTLAHSLTLASSALGLLTLRPPPVEATIALSIVLVAAEALHDRRTLARRWPALVAFLFGLVHGLGFAGALQQVGLPQQHLSIALVSFNVGVEIGQLMVVALAFVLVRALKGRPALRLARTPALYAIGGVAAYWSIARIAAIVG